MDLNDIYTELILEHSKNSRNKREIENPTYRELGHNPSCGDEITLMMKIDEDVIEDISYVGHGCAISQASTSIMIDNVKKKKMQDARSMAMKFIAMIKGEIANEEELEDLGDAIAFENIQNLPARVKCAVLPWHTLIDMIDHGKKEASFNVENIE